MSNQAQIIPPPPELSSSVDQAPLLFKHNLAGHELFSRSRLRNLIEQIGALPPKSSKTGRPVTRGFFIMKGLGQLEWGSSEFQKALNSAFNDIDLCGARIKLSSIHQIDTNGEVLSTCVTNLSDATGVDFSKRFSRAIATLFITSPCEFTPYHIDQEVNFLLQIQGEKEVQVFDGRDSSIVTPKNLEGFWTGQHFIEQQATSRPKTFKLEAGNGIHHPSFFPHTVQVGKKMSVSLSLEFQRAQFTVAEVSLMNAYLRKLGMKPTPPGVNRGLDAMKTVIARPTIRAKNAILGSAGIPLSSLQRKFQAPVQRAS